MYSVLPILANTVIGLRGVDATLIEAARGLGMSERQMLFRVQLPLALPVIIGGIRTATVLVVGTATLVTPVGGESLGNYIFSGLESMNPASTVFGCVVAALLAVVMDQLVRLLEVAARRRSRPLAWVGGLGLLLVFGGGLASPLTRLFERRQPGRDRQRAVHRAAHPQRGDRPAAERGRLPPRPAGRHERGHSDRGAAAQSD